MKAFRIFFRYLFLILGAFMFFAAVFVTLTAVSIGNTKTKNVLAEILDVNKPIVEEKQPLPEFFVGYKAQIQDKIEQIDRDSALLESQFQGQSYALSQTQTLRLKEEKPEEARDKIMQYIQSFDAYNVYASCFPSYESEDQPLRCSVSFGVGLPSHPMIQDFLDTNFTIDQQSTNSYSINRSTLTTLRNSKLIYQQQAGLLDLIEQNPSTQNIASLVQAFQTNQQTAMYDGGQNYEVQNIAYPRFEIEIAPK